MKMFSSTCIVLSKLIDEGWTSAQRGGADCAYEILTSFDFIFVMHLMKEIITITNILCQALQRKSLDVPNALHLVSNTKVLLQKLRDDG